MLKLMGSGLKVTSPRARLTLLAGATAGIPEKSVVRIAALNDQLSLSLDDLG